MNKLIFKTYLKTINNSPGSKMFRNLYVQNNGQIKDVVENGKLSCAFFVTSILKLFGLIKSIHATVENTIEDLKKFNWKKVNIKSLRAGDILVWEKEKTGNNSDHSHIGFYIGKDKAISNSTYKKVPVKHPFDFKKKRKIIAAFHYKNWPN